MEGGNAKYLDQAILSIADQSLQPKEIILVEDGPLTVDLKQTINRWQAKMSDVLRVVTLSQHSGLGMAMKVGTQHVTTGWIARMDADDIAVPDRFARQINVLMNNPQLAILGGQVDEFTQDIEHILRQRQVPTTLAQIKQFNKLRCPFNHPTVMINKDALLAVGGYQSFGSWEDYYLWERMLAAGYEVANLDDILVHMRVDKDQYSRRGKVSNVPYIWRLQQYMYHHNLLSKSEFIWSTLVKFVNAIAPVSWRRKIYQRFLLN